VSAERRYRRLLRWYPEDWRREHEEVVLGMLLDDADAAGRDGPATGEAIGLVIGGIAQHTWRRNDRRRTTATALIVAAVLALLYAVTVTWSPSTAYAGYLGPFSNPTVLVASALAVAAGLALAGRTGAARLLAVASVAELVVLVVAAERSGWMGPGVGVLALLAPPALSGALPPKGVRGAARDAAAAIGLVLVLIGAGIAASYSALLVELVASDVPLPAVDLEIAAFAVAAPLLALAARWPLRRRSRAAGAAT
jgi:hypothetical protein